MRVSFLLAGGLLLLSASGCNTPEVVAAFCSSSNATLVAAIPAFQDLGGSCLRVKNLQQEIGSFTLVSSDPGCDAIATKATGAIAAAQILSEYLTAVNAVASFGVAGTASNASALASQASAALGAHADAQTAIGSIAQFLTAVAVRGYQQKSLKKDIVAVSGNVGAVTDALASILQTEYINQELGDEEQKIAAHYKSFAISHPAGDLTLELDDRWRADEADLVARRAAAQDLVYALGTIKAGTAALAANAKTLHARELPGLLEPYIAQLQTLIPQIQKGF